VGDCLDVQFVNLLDPDGSKDGSTTRNAAVHIQGLELRDIKGDGSFAGNNPSSFCPARYSGTALSTTTLQRRKAASSCTASMTAT